MKNQENKHGWLFWTPRVIAIIFILFLALFSLDIFDSANNYTFWETVLGLFMHNLPVFILAIALWISWPEKRGWLAGSIFILGGILYIGRLLMTSFTNGFEFYYLSWSITIAGPAIFVGILFFIGWRKQAGKQKNSSAAKSPQEQHQ